MKRIDLPRHLEEDPVIAHPKAEQPFEFAAERLYAASTGLSIAADRLKDT
ncbi:MAG: hypothetical protein ACRD6B_14355 [Bryobacteraceae bacterium]